MPKVHEFDGLRFTFEDQWTTLQYDAEPEHQKNPNQDIISHAVDLLAVVPDQTIYFIEAKDFRINPGNDRKKVMPGGTLASTVAHKVRDTIAGVTAFHRTASETNNRRSVYAPFAKALGKSSVHLKVILWMETNERFLPLLKQKQRASVFNKELKSKLSWITSEVLVCNQNIVSNADLGVSVSNLPRTN